MNEATKVSKDHRVNRDTEEILDSLARKVNVDPWDIKVKKDSLVTVAKLADQEKQVKLNSLEILSIQHIEYNERVQIIV